MQRTWVVPPAVVATVLATQLGSSEPADSRAALDLAVSSALAQAEAAAAWECATPHHDPSRRAARFMATGTVLQFSEDAMPDAMPDAGQTGTAEGAVKMIP